MKKKNKRFSDRYLKSQWGYDEVSKKQELQSTTARYLILKTQKSVPVAYVHYRFVVENLFPVLYCYEIQIEKEYQHQKIGSKLIELLENLAQKTNMEKIMATVFVYNKQSLTFFYKHGFVPDKMSPLPQENFDYVILSKLIKL